MTKKVAAVVFVAIVVFGCYMLGPFGPQNAHIAAKPEPTIDQRVANLEEHAKCIESKLDAIDDKLERILRGKGPEQLFLGKPERKK